MKAVALGGYEVVYVTITRYKIIRAKNSLSQLSDELACERDLLIKKITINIIYWTIYFLI